MWRGLWFWVVQGDEIIYYNVIIVYSFSVLQVFPILLPDLQGQFSIFLSGFNVKRDIHTGCARVLESEWNVISVEGMTARVMYLFIIVLSEPGKFYIATYRSLDERRLAIIFRKVYIIF